MEKRSEVKYTFMGIVLTAFHILGVDINLVLQAWQGAGIDPETMSGLEEMAPQIREYASGGWQSLVAMWGGLAAYSWFRTRIKTQG